mgnify:CR=1 FL=1
MKIDVRSRELLGEKGKKYKLSRRVRDGLVTAALIIGIPGMMFINSKNEKNKDFGNPPPGIEEFQDVVLEESLEAKLDQINPLEISPMEALNLLVELKEIKEKQKS